MLQLIACNALRPPISFISILKSMLICQLKLSVNMNVASEGRKLKSFPRMEILILWPVSLHCFRGFHVGFNSLCAQASVNHLHFHTWYSEYSSYLETAVSKGQWWSKTIAVKGWMYNKNGEQCGQDLLFLLLFHYYFVLLGNIDQANVFKYSNYQYFTSGQYI